MKIRNSIAMRLTAVLFCVILPLMGMALSLYRNGSHTISTQIHEDALSALEIISEGFSQELKVLYSTLGDYSSNTTLSHVAYSADYMENADYFQAVYTVQENLLDFQRNNTLIAQFVAYFSSEGKALSSGDTWYSRAYYTYTQESFDEFVSLVRAYGNTTLLYAGEESFIGLLAPAGAYYSERTPVYALKLIVDEAGISRYLADRDVREGRSTSVYYHLADRFYHGERNALGASVFEQLLQHVEAEYPRTNSKYAHAFEFTTDGTRYFAAVRYDTALDMSFMQLIPRNEAMASLDQFRGLLHAFLALALIAFVGCCWLSLSMVRKPILRLVQGFRGIENGDYSVRVTPKRDAGELVYLMNAFNRMSGKLNDTINRLYKSEIYTQRMELTQLQMQINPHFLYNSYFLLDRMLEQGDYETAERVSRYLGEYFRYINRNAKSFVPLPVEWAHVHSYAMIQALRYKRRLSIEIQPVPEALREYIVPRLILQPLMENSIEHGLAHATENGRAILRFEVDVQHIFIIVEDSGNDIADEAIRALEQKLTYYDKPGQDTSALINIHRRLQLYYGEPFGLLLSRAEIGGLRVTLQLPRTLPEDKHALEQGEG
ncbi:MAG: histidine kinase [Clostridiales bacterium]|nr:histidine kinase [Clostridiales bacterium]